MWNKSAYRTSFHCQWGWRDDNSIWNLWNHSLPSSIGDQSLPVCMWDCIISLHLSMVGSSTFTNTGYEPLKRTFWEGHFSWAMPSFGDFGVCTSSKFLCPDPPCFESHSTAPHVANKFQLHFLLRHSSFNSWKVRETKIYIQLTLEQDHYNHYSGGKGIYPPWN